MINRLMPRSPGRLSLLLAVLIAAGGYFFMIAPAQSAIGDDEATVAACGNEILTANTTIRHARDVETLTVALLREVNGVEQPPNDTMLVKTVWDELQRVASDNHVTLTDVHHDKVRSVDVAAIATTPPRAPRAQKAAPGPGSPSAAGACLDPSATPTSRPAAATDRTGQSTSMEQPATAGAPAQNGASVPQRQQAAVQLQVLPVIATFQGRYLNIIKAVAALSRAHVLLRYDKSRFDVSPGDGDRVVKTEVTLLAYPPLMIDAVGRPVSRFSTLRADSVGGGKSTPAPAPPGGAQTR